MLGCGGERWSIWRLTSFRSRSCLSLLLKHAGDCESARSDEYPKASDSSMGDGDEIDRTEQKSGCHPCLNEEGSGMSLVTKPPPSSPAPETHHDHLPRAQTPHSPAQAPRAHTISNPRSHRSRVIAFQMHLHALVRQVLDDEPRRPGRSRHGPRVGSRDRRQVENEI